MGTAGFWDVPSDPVLQLHFTAQRRSRKKAAGHPTLLFFPHSWGVSHNFVATLQGNVPSALWEWAEFSFQTHLQPSQGSSMVWCCERKVSHSCAAHQHRTGRAASICTVYVMQIKALQETGKALGAQGPPTATRYHGLITHCASLTAMLLQRKTLRLQHVKHQLLCTALFISEEKPCRLGQPLPCLPTSSRGL